MTLFKSSLLLLMTLALTAAQTDLSFNILKGKKVPPMYILGKTDGSIVRCLKAMPSYCETYYSGSSTVTAVVVHGEFLFAGLKTGDLLRCVWEKKGSCEVFQKVGSEITGLAVAAGHLHAGVQDGRILRCSMNTPNSCLTLAHLERSIFSLAATESHVYAGVDQGRIHRCELSGSNCSLFCTSSRSNPNHSVTGLATIEDKVFGVLSYGYLQYGNGTSDVCEGFELPFSGLTGMTAHNGQLYMVSCYKGIRINMPGSQETSVDTYDKDANSIAFAYGTCAMDEKYQMESNKCIYDGVLCPPTVFYYDVENRAPLEVHVKNNRLYDSRGVLLDTSNADDSHAIFAMGPDGQILLSKMHRRGLLHTSSLLAGRPVSGAGRVVVKQGRIESIAACSEHYSPDLTLNQQVLQVLRAKGYTEHVDSYPCTCDEGTCGENVVPNLSGNVH